MQDVERLSGRDARALFPRHAGEQFAGDPALPGLLADLDGHPLSIELLAANARGKPNLKGWPPIGATGARLLKAGTADARLKSLRVSLEISLEALVRRARRIG